MYCKLYFYGGSFKGNATNANNREVFDNKTLMGVNKKTFLTIIMLQLFSYMESRIFWAQMALALLVAISGPKKISIFRRDHPFQCPS